MKSLAEICVWRRFFVTFALLQACLLPVRAQSSDASSASRLTMQGAADQGGAPIVRDALGRPCLDIEAAARAEVVNPDMLDHVVSLKNNCSRIIRAKVCYFNGDHCNDVVVRGYSRVDTILGAMRGVKFFRYSIVQK